MDEAKRELIQLWLTKAEHDLIAARTLADAKDRVLDVAIYHCQQAAEKSVKAFLIANDIRFEKIHDIKVLLNLALPLAPSFFELMDKADRLTDYATEYRYPGENVEPELEEFNQGFEDAQNIYQAMSDIIKRSWAE